MFNISKKINYRNFGYIPTGNRKKDFRGWLLGEENLIKRLQAKDIIDALDLKETDRVLDLGCGRGYISIEIAKIAKETLAIDVNPYVQKIIVPDFLKHKLRYEMTRGENIQQPDNSFDVILASEVLVMIPTPDAFLQEVKRLLKPGGRVVFVNGVGRESIKQAYKENSAKLQAIRNEFGDKVPPTFEEYEQKLVKAFGTSIHRFVSEDEYCTMIENSGLTIAERRHSPKQISSDKIYWRQFRLFIEHNKAIPTSNFVLWFLWLRFLSFFSKTPCKSGSIIIANKLL